MAHLRFALLFFLSSPSYVLKIPSHPQRLRRLTYRHKHAPPPQSPPTEFSTNTDAIRRISLQHPPIHPSIQSIHPYLPPKRMEPRMLPLPQLLPLLKGTPAPFFGQPFTAETTDDIKKYMLEKRRQNCRPERSRLTPCLSIADLRSCSRLYILPDNTESRAHAQWGRTCRSRDLQLTALLLTEWREHGSDCLQESVSLFLRLMSASCTEFVCLHQMYIAKCSKEVNDACDPTATFTSTAIAKEKYYLCVHLWWFL